MCLKFIGTSLVAKPASVHWIVLSLLRIFAIQGYHDKGLEPLWPNFYTNSNKIVWLSACMVPNQE